jgi:hypothetical protein
MSTSGVAEQEATLAYAQAQLLSGRIYDDIPDEAALARDESSPTLPILPYGVLTFDAPFETELDRTLTGPEDQPLIMPVLFEFWAPTRKQAREAAGACRTTFIGWSPSATNATAYQAYRGVGFRNNRDSTGRPTRFVELVALATILNMSRP